MTIAGIARLAGRRPRHDGVRKITPVEARLLRLRPSGAADVGLAAADYEDTQGVSEPRIGHGVPTYVRIAVLLAVSAALVVAAAVNGRGGHAVSRQSVPSDLVVSGSGRMPVTVAPGDVTVRVSVRSAAIPWFWCLESSRGLPPEQHICRNSGATVSAGEPTVTSGVVHLDAASVEGTAFFVQMYCREACDWRADAQHDGP